MADIVRQPSEEGTLQGSPLSPLLSNVSLDDLDRVLERRGHHFVRCTDDITIYVRSERPAERVMKGSMQLVERLLKLRVNRDKSAVDSAWRWTLLGFGFLRRAGRVDPKARKCAKDRLRRLTSRRWGSRWGGGSLRSTASPWDGGPTSRWPTPRALEDLDEWLRGRMRQVRWKEWKRCRTRLRNL